VLVIYHLPRFSGQRNVEAQYIGLPDDLLHADFAGKVVTEAGLIFIIGDDIDTKAAEFAGEALSHEPITNDPYGTVAKFNAAVPFAVPDSFADLDIRFSQ